MPFKRKGRSTYSIGPLRAGTIDIPWLSTGIKNKDTAKAMEAGLRELAINYPDLVQRVANKELSLLDLYTARVQGDDALRALRQRADDPLLARITQALREILTDKRVLTGLDQLDGFTSDGVRLSWLRTPAHITEMYARARKQGRKPNSVRRSLHCAVSEVLRHSVGRGQMLAIMADVKVPYENDERVVNVDPAELERLLECCDVESRDIVETAALTGVDQGPLLRLECRHFHDDPERPELDVPDTKASARQRTIPLSNAAANLLRRIAAGRQPHGRIFRLTYKQLRGRWEAARAAADLEHVRFKDLRAVFATPYLNGGGNPKDLQNILGHSTPAMTLRYIRRLPLLQHDAMDAAARALGRYRGEDTARRRVGHTLKRVYQAKFRRVPFRVPNEKRL